MSLFFRRLTQGFWAAERLLRASMAMHRRAMMVAVVLLDYRCKKVGEHCCALLVS